MKLKNVTTVMKPFKKGRYTLHPKGETFSIEVKETEGFYQLVKDKSSKRWFLVELDGQLVMISEFTVNKDGNPNWMTMCVLPYIDLIEEDNSMLPLASTIIKRYFS